MKTFKQFLDTPVLSPEDLADKHKVSVDEIQKQLEMGIKVEGEHTTKPKIARQIALAHIGEDPEYYSKLKEMEG